MNKMFVWMIHYHVYSMLGERPQMTPFIEITTLTSCVDICLMKDETDYSDPEEKQ